MEVTQLEAGWRLEKYDSHTNARSHCAAKKGTVVVYYDGVNIHIKHAHGGPLERVNIPASIFLEVIEHEVCCGECEQEEDGENDHELLCTG